MAEYGGGPVVADGLGGISAGGTLQMMTASAQPGGVGTSRAPGLHHSAGFLHVFQLAGEGLPDELNPDNDADNLLDEQELAGTSFDPQTETDPNRADSDGDGSRDDAEALAGTDPWDEDSFLHLTANAPIDLNDYRIEWPGRAGRTYRLSAGPDLNRPGDFVPLAVLSAPGPGAGPWQVVPMSWTNTPAEESTSFIMLRLVP